jgi:hypothetical protein
MPFWVNTAGHHVMPFPVLGAAALCRICTSAFFVGGQYPVRSNAWRPEMPSAPDWRSTAVYAYLNELDAAEFAWEFLRRNPAYKRDYRTAVRRMASGHADALPLRWGLRFPFRPRAAGRPNAAGLAAAAQFGRGSPHTGAAGVHRRAKYRGRGTAIRASCRRRRTLDRQRRRRSSPCRTH